MPLQVAVESKIPQNVKRIIHLLQCPTRLVSPVPAPPQVLLKNLPPLLWSHAASHTSELCQRVARVRVENGSDDFFFRLGVVIYERDRVSRFDWDLCQELGGEGASDSVGLSEILARAGSFDKLGNQRVQRAMDAVSY